MWMPILRGWLDRRLLLNYRIDPVIVQRCLPAPFRPKVINGHGLAGVCLIRMKRIGPRFLPFPVCRSSENAALRFAVEWDSGGQMHSGVYIPARYTTSRLAAFAGMRYFPGRHVHTPLNVDEKSGQFRITLDSELKLSVTARPASCFRGSQVFKTLAEASEFFRLGDAGYSESLRANTFDGVTLHIFDWKADPLEVENISCDYFDDPIRFPAGTAQFDCGLLMRSLPNEFRLLPSFKIYSPVLPATAIAGQSTAG